MQVIIITPEISSFNNFFLFLFIFLSIALFKDLILCTCKHCSVSSFTYELEIPFSSLNKKK